MKHSIQFLQLLFSFLETCWKKATVDVNDYLGMLISPTRQKNWQKRMGLLPWDWHCWDRKMLSSVCVCYLESHQREGHSSEGLTGTTDSLWAAGMEGVPARKGFMPVLTLALLSLISCAILDTQNDASDRHSPSPRGSLHPKAQQGTQSTHFSYWHGDLSQCQQRVDISVSFSFLFN